MKNHKSATEEHTSEIKTTAKVGWLNEFLWTCSGANKAVLRQCPSDYAKYAGIGGTILFTALMAAFSGGYALNFVFKNVYVAMVFGLFWGALIFNLDRFIVNTMYSDGKHTISWGEIKSGLPRIVMAIFLGIVISTPLELKIFEDKIKMTVEEEKSKLLDLRVNKLEVNLQQLDEKIDAVELGSGDIYTDFVHSGNARLDAIGDSINALQPQLNSVQNQINGLLSKKHALDPKAEDYSTRLANLNKQLAPLYQKRTTLSGSIRKLRAEYSSQQADAQSIQRTQLDEKRDRLSHLRSERDSVANLIAQARAQHKGWSPEDIRNKGSERDKIDLEYNGFNAQLKAFHDIREEDPSTNVAAWFIMLLFIIVETAPTFFKMMMEDGPYDDLLRAEKHRVRVLAEKRISDVNDEVNTSVKISTLKNQKRLEAEAIANEEILKRIAIVQAELLQKSIDAWREEELNKIKENPSSYINVGTKTENGNNA